MNAGCIFLQNLAYSKVRKESSKMSRSLPRTQTNNQLASSLVSEPVFSEKGPIDPNVHCTLKLHCTIGTVNTSDKAGVP